MLHSFTDGRGTRQRLYSPDGLIRLAQSNCGCPVAASPAELTALERLCAAFEGARPGQTAFGKFHAQAVLLDALSKRFRLADYMRRFPDIGAVQLPTPVFIVAPFRTGTTFLQRLLSCDPQNRSPRIWEVAYPPPAEPSLRNDIRHFCEDARIARAAAALRTLHRASPALGRLHPMATDLAEECFGLLETSLLSHSFMFYAELPSYLNWLDNRSDADWRAAYQIYAAQLQLLHWWHPGRRWVLKSPVHLWNLDALLHSFPQATVIQLHRDPVDTITSFCRLLAAYRQSMCTNVDPTSIGEQVFLYTRQLLQRAVTARRTSDQARFVDIRFDDLIDNPMACIHAIYARLGARLAPEATAAMLGFLSQPRREPIAAERCTDGFGLNQHQVRDMFSAYSGLHETSVK